MNEIEKLAEIEKARQKFEKKLAKKFGIDATVNVALHFANFEQYAGGCALGWHARINGVGPTLAVSGPTRPGDIGDTVLYYHPNATAFERQSYA